MKIVNYTKKVASFPNVAIAFVFAYIAAALVATPAQANITPQCGTANELAPQVNLFAGEVMGVALVLVVPIVVIVFGLLLGAIFLPKYRGFLITGAVLVIVIGALLTRVDGIAGALVNNPCTG